MINPEFTKSLEKYVCIGLKESKKEENHVDDGKFHIMRRFNGSILICGKRRSKFPYQCFVGPDWPMVALVYFLIISINVIVLYVISGLGYPVIIIGAIGAGIVLISYSITACSDPGFIFESDYALLPSPSQNNIHNHSNNCSNRDIEMGETSAIQSRSSESSGTNTPATSNPKSSSGLPTVPPPTTIECGHCQLQRPYSAHHCQYCSNCIDKLDHHCPWCGKCIGKKNIGAFQAFLCSLCFQFYFLIGAGIYYGIAVYADGIPTGPGFQ